MGDSRGFLRLNSPCVTRLPPIKRTRACCCHVWSWRVRARSGFWVGLCRTSFEAGWQTQDNYIHSSGETNVFWWSCYLSPLPSLDSLTSNLITLNICLTPSFTLFLCMFTNNVSITFNRFCSHVIHVFRLTPHTVSKSIVSRLIYFWRHAMTIYLFLVLVSPATPLLAFSFPLHSSFVPFAGSLANIPHPYSTVRLTTMVYSLTFGLKGVLFYYIKHPTLPLVLFTRSYFIICFFQATVFCLS